MPALPSEDPIATGSADETEEARLASLGSSPSRHSSSLPCPTARRSSNIFSRTFGHKSRHSSDGNGLKHGALSSESSRQVSPWASIQATPISTPATSVGHGDVGADSPLGIRTSEKKRLSWFGSTSVSHWTSHHAPSPAEGFSAPPTRPGSRRQPSHAGSWSSSSSSSAPHTQSSKQGESTESSKHTDEFDVAMLVPNAQFLGLMLLMILLISSPLIKILSVLLFITVIVLDDV